MHVQPLASGMNKQLLSFHIIICKEIMVSKNSCDYCASYVFTKFSQYINQLSIDQLWILHNNGQYPLLWSREYIMVNPLIMVIIGIVVATVAER